MVSLVSLHLIVKVSSSVSTCSQCLFCIVMSVNMLVGLLMFNVYWVQFEIESII